jgi:hypothetical protein
MGRFRTILAVLMTGVGVSCGPDNPLLLTGAPSVLTGKDSAGALIELRALEDVFTHARIADPVLGSAEAEIRTSGDGGIVFTVRFPLGAVVSYVGLATENPPSEAKAIAGTWTQHASGLFGEDWGTWEVGSDRD